MLRSTVMTPPMVGSTWLRVHSTLESDCLPALSQGAALLCLVVDLLIVIFTVATHIRCLVIGVVLVRLINRLTFSLSYMRPWGLFSNQLSGPLTWYFVSMTDCLLFDSLCCHYRPYLLMLYGIPYASKYLQLLYLDRSTLAIGMITQADVAFSEMYK